MGVSMFDKFLGLFSQNAREFNKLEEARSDRKTRMRNIVTDIDIKNSYKDKYYKAIAMLESGMLTPTQKKLFLKCAKFYGDVAVGNVQIGSQEAKDYYKEEEKLIKAVNKEKEESENE